MPCRGAPEHLGIIMCGTPQCIGGHAPRRVQLRSAALAAGGGPLRARGDVEGFAGAGHPARAADLRGTAGADRKLAEIHAELFDYTQKISEADMVAFIQIEFGRIGADVNITPRARSSAISSSC